MGWKRVFKMWRKNRKCRKDQKLLRTQLQSLWSSEGQKGAGTDSASGWRETEVHDGKGRRGEVLWQSWPALQSIGHHRWPCPHPVIPEWRRFSCFIKFYLPEIHFTPFLVEPGISFLKWFPQASASPSSLHVCVHVATGFHFSLYFIFWFLILWPFLPPPHLWQLPICFLDLHELVFVIFLDSTGKKGHKYRFPLRMLVCSPFFLGRLLCSHGLFRLLKWNGTCSLVFYFLSLW